ncbi:hypothetical protein [Brevibacterium casei]|uniref:hypothetical protein n=1 Tax=Brevibacterium casei TaxID=33889 RepID=UPI0013DF1787|nr:hypothetical protein [Brevibacterium casei]
MPVLINDTARNNLPSWTVSALGLGHAIGGMLSPFTSPPEGNGYKVSATETSERIINGGGEFWFDSMTYALTMPRVGDFRYYRLWDLWEDDTQRGKLETRSDMKSHIDKVYQLQTLLHCKHLAPSILLSNADSKVSELALMLSDEAVSISPDAWLTIAGDNQFWSSGAELDSHIGALDQLEPEGWMLVVTRGDNSMPPAATADEIYGLMRTCYALSRDRPVRVAFGDLAALPAVAAGAEAIGSGWDLRQRICAYQDFEERAGEQDGGGWYQRPTLRGIMGGLSNGEYNVLSSEAPALAIRLSPGNIGPKPKQAFLHHVKTLSNLINEMNSMPVPERTKTLRTWYDNAISEWPTVRSITGTKIDERRWIQPFLDGVDRFAKAEGWL